MAIVEMTMVVMYSSSLLCLSYVPLSGKVEATRATVSPAIRT